MKTIVETNKEIAIFMGDISSTDDRISFSKNCPVEQLKYDESWDWLMPVIEKIETMSMTRGRHFYLHMDAAFVQIRVDRVNLQPLAKWGATNNKMQAVYNAVVEFIEWYAKNKK